MKKIKSILKKIKLSWLIVLFIMTSVMDVFSMKISEWPQIIKRCRIMKQQKQAKEYDKSLGILCVINCGGGTAKLYINKEELVESNGKQANLNELLKKHNICLGWPKGQWDKQKTWEIVYSKLLGQTEHEKTDAMFVPEELQRLLVDAKTIFKKFLITNNNDLITVLGSYIKENVFNQLFIYAKQDRDNVRRSQKFLVIYDKQFWQYVSSENSSDVIDNILNFSIQRNAQISIEYDNTRYELNIYSQPNFHRDLI